MSSPRYVPGSTFNLSSVYRALGIRDARVIPNVGAAQLVPVVNLGNFETFAPQVVEARGMAASGPHNVLGGQWFALSLQSTAPGGTIIEQTSVGDNATLNIAPQKPFAGALETPFTMGGQPISSLIESSGIQTGASPNGVTLGGSATGPLSGNLVEIGVNIWVPPGSFFWVVMFQNPNARAGWRFREVPESQGPA